MYARVALVIVNFLQVLNVFFKFYSTCLMKGFSNILIIYLFNLSTTAFEKKEVSGLVRKLVDLLLGGWNCERFEIVSSNPCRVITAKSNTVF